MKKLLVIITTLAVFGSCKVAFVPSSSVVVKAQVTQAIKTTDSLFTAEEASSDKSFDTYSVVYYQIQNSITNIQSLDSARPKSGLLLSQLARLKTRFQSVVSTHQVKGVLNNGEIETYKNILAGLWLPILVSENSLK